MRICQVQNRENALLRFHASERRLIGEARPQPAQPASGLKHSLRAGGRIGGIVLVAQRVERSGVRQHERQRIADLGGHLVLRAAPAAQVTIADAKQARCLA